MFCNTSGGNVHQKLCQNSCKKNYGKMNCPHHQHGSLDYGVCLPIQSCGSYSSSADNIEFGHFLLSFCEDWVKHYKLRRITHMFAELFNNTVHCLAMFL